jgi:DNA polymerase I-like protein with 3'-5' exonuclease and polymerase domains
VELDAAGQEFRWMAIESDDPTMLTLCEAGEDAHAYMGAEIDPRWEYKKLSTAAKKGNAEAGKSRKLGKVSNLSCQYRIGKKKFRSTARVQYDLPLSFEDASSMHDTYHRTYPGVKQYWKNAVAKAKRRGFAETLAGRRVQLNVNWTDPESAWMYESAAINFPIQGVGADQKFLAIASVGALAKKLGALFYFELHDGLYFIVPSKRAKKFALMARKLLNNMNYAKAWHGFIPPVPLPWDAKIGPSWGNMEELP